MTSEGRRILALRRCFGSPLRCRRRRFGLADPGYRSRRRRRRPRTDLGFALLEQLQKSSPAGITQAALMALDDARVAARPILEARPDLLEKLGDDVAVR